MNGRHYYELGLIDEDYDLVQTLMEAQLEGLNGEETKRLSSRPLLHWSRP